jgi:hypothetical protein
LPAAAVACPRNTATSTIVRPNDQGNRRAAQTTAK